jgi:7-carboxy-7-deazaguanine synthase
MNAIAGRDAALPVNEIFTTIQGEATFTGTPAVFIRLQGCAVGCPWCDTKFTWEVDPANEVAGDDVAAKTASGSASWARMTPSALLDRIRRSHPVRHVVITGGEPCDQDLTDLTTVLIRHGLVVQIETSGTAPVRVHPDAWVTLSPKIGMPGGKTVLDEALLRANEIKMPVGKADDVDVLRDLLMRLRALDPHSTPLVWLQPLSTSRKATALCAEEAYRSGSWRVSLQAHVLAGIR